MGNNERAHPESPNLFAYATSELSQDAFICWLAAWADSKWKDVNPALHKAGVDFVFSMICKVKSAYDPVRINTVKVRRQVDKLDILIEVNRESPDEKLAILVEDKTHTDHHSGQLERYYKQVIEEGYSADQMIPIYFKTGYQSRFDNLGDFQKYLRYDFLEMLRKGKADGVKNDIYNEFLQHLEEMDAVIRQFSFKGLGAWDHNDWRGFFMVLYDSRSKLYEPYLEDGANWNYVANPSGGFYGFWWYFKDVAGKAFTPYLQLEEKTLCFKIMVEGESDRRSAREEAYQKIQQISSQINSPVQRPERMGNGKFMTVARWVGDYREFNNGQLDMDTTLTNLKKAQDILDLAFKV